MSEIILGPTGIPVVIPTLAISGLEALHTWDEQIVLNDRSVWPRYKVERIQGLRSKADLEAPADVAVGRMGEIPRLAFKRGKTITYEGLTQARSLADLRTAEAELAAALAPDDERTMVVAEHVVYGTGAYQFNARCVMAEGVEEQTASPHRASFGYERAFAFALRMSDPRYYATTLTEVNSGAVTGTPKKSSAAVAMSGNAETDPVITIVGPVKSPILRHAQMNKHLRLTRAYGAGPAALTLAAGRELTIDFARRTVTLDDGADYRKALNLADSDWWDAAVPGLLPDSTNTIELTAGADQAYFVAPAHIEVVARAAYW